MGGANQRVNSIPLSLSVNPNPLWRLGEGNAHLVPFLLSPFPTSSNLKLTISTIVGLRDSQLHTGVFLVTTDIILLIMTDGAVTFLRLCLCASLYYLP